MTQELFEILRPRINARVLEVVHNHLDDEQIGLLLVKLINPYIILSQQEEAKLRGVDRKTLRGMKSRGEIPCDGDVKRFAAPNRPESGEKLPNPAQKPSPGRKPV